MASSRPIAAGEDYTPDDINNLRNDVLDPVGGHKHNGADGAKIPFANLDVTGAAGSTAPAGGSKSYNSLANHVASSQGQHGLNAAVYVAGCNQPSFMVQCGHASVGTVTFPAPFSDTPAVVVSGLGAMGGIGEYLGYCITSVSSTGFTVERGSDSPATIMWLALGPRNP